MLVYTLGPRCGYREALDGAILASCDEVQAKGAALFDRPPVTARALHFWTDVYTERPSR
jgi:hypothetical protein